MWRLGLYVEAGLARPTASGLSKPVEPYVLVVHTYIIQLQTDRDPATVGNSPWQLVSGRELHSPNEKLVDRKPRMITARLCAKKTCIHP